MSMSIKKEFEKLVKEANQKLEQQNQKRDAAQLKAFKEMRRRQQLMMNILSQNRYQDKLDPSFGE